MSLEALQRFRNHISKHIFIEDDDNEFKNNFLYKYHYFAKCQSAVSMPALILACIHLQLGNLSFMDFQELLEATGVNIISQAHLPVEDNISAVFSNIEDELQLLSILSFTPLQTIQLNSQEYVALQEILYTYGINDFEDIFELNEDYKQMEIFKLLKHLQENNNQFTTEQENQEREKLNYDENQKTDQIINNSQIKQEIVEQHKEEKKEIIDKKDVILIQKIQKKMTITILIKSYLQKSVKK